MFRMVQQEKQMKTMRSMREFSRTQSDNSVSLDDSGALINPGDSVSSFSSIESLSTRSRDRSRDARQFKYRHLNINLKAFIILLNILLIILEINIVFEWFS